jgi:hypothetical protein
VHADDLPLLCRGFGIPLAELLAHADQDDLSALQVRP